MSDYERPTPDNTPRPARDDVPGRMATEGPAGVYDRPEGTGSRANMVALVVILVVVALLAFLLVPLVL